MEPVLDRVLRVLEDKIYILMEQTFKVKLQAHVVVEGFALEYHDEVKVAVLSTFPTRPYYPRGPTPFGSLNQPKRILLKRYAPCRRS